MVLMFLIALLLAWPTYGLSLVAFVGYSVFFKGWVKAEHRMFEADSARAMRAVSNSHRERYPSWYGNPQEVEIFKAVVTKKLSTRGIPVTFVRKAMDNEEYAGTLFSFLAEMELEGSSKLNQYLGAENLLIKTWESIPPLDRGSLLLRG